MSDGRRRRDDSTRELGELLELVEGHAELRDYLDS